METSSTAQDDLDALAARRERLRAFASLLAEAVEAIPLPETYLEVERAARAVTLADAMTVRLSPAPEDTLDAPPVNPLRLRLRDVSDRLLEALTRLPMPDTFLISERAGRAVVATDRMLTQLYQPPKLPKNANYDPDDPATEPETSANDVFDKALSRVDRMTRNYAKECGVWPDGMAFADAPEIDQRRFDAVDRETMSRPVEGMDGTVKRMAMLATGRANAIARRKAEISGQWFDGSAYDQGDPDPYGIARRFDEKVMKQPPLPHDGWTEDKGPDCGFPWWLKRRIPPAAPP